MAKTATKTAKSIRTEIRIPDEYRPISMWGYFGYEILFMLPLIGWILLIIFALTANNINLRNFARSQFCLLIIYVVMWLVLCITGVLAGLVDQLM